jgi:uncharacterized protein YjbI with pentapeptide repeats
VSPEPGLRADCARCFGLCCVVPAFATSVDFAIDKPAGQACPNLRTDFGCGIHAELRPRGFRGCTVYDCFGAGQQVSQVTFGGRSWRDDPSTAQQMFDVFVVMRHLHELLWYLHAALAMEPARSLHDEVRARLDATARVAGYDAGALTDFDVAEDRRDVAELLQRVSALVRAEVPGVPPTHNGADLIGADLSGADLRGADFRGAYLIGANLSRADLRWADLIGADLRDTDLSGADLSTALFLTQAQLDAAKGDAGTALPPSLRAPKYWSLGDL